MKKKAIKSNQLAYLKLVLDRTNMTPTELARKAKVDPSTLTRFLNNPQHKSILSATTLSKIEALTHIKAPLPTAIVPLPSPVRFLEVWGKAAAGAWLEVGIADEIVAETIPVGPSPRYAGKTQYALKIQGTSVNRKPQAQDGAYAICIPWADLGLEMPPENKFVHVQRSRGALTEVTIKRVQYKNGMILLCPYSTDPKHEKCLELSHPDEDTIVEIKGLVIGWYSDDD